MRQNVNKVVFNQLQEIFCLVFICPNIKVTLYYHQQKIIIEKFKVSSSVRKFSKFIMDLDRQTQKLVNKNVLKSIVIIINRFTIVKADIHLFK